MSESSATSYGDFDCEFTFGSHEWSSCSYCTHNLAGHGNLLFMSSSKRIFPVCMFLTLKLYSVTAVFFMRALRKRAL